MLIATRAPQSAKLRKSGMNGGFGPHRPPAVAERTRIHAAPTELKQASGVVPVINMALLMELEPSPPSKLRVAARLRHK